MQANCGGAPVLLKVLRKATHELRDAISFVFTQHDGLHVHFLDSGRMKQSNVEQWRNPRSPAKRNFNPDWALQLGTDDSDYSLPLLSPAFIREFKRQRAEVRGSPLCQVDFTMCFSITYIQLYTQL